MEYFSHRDLAQCVKTALPESQVADITSQILEALQILHGMSITHRDLKPQNILVAELGPRWWVKIGDFGISKRVSEDTILDTRGTGTIAFMAPEVLDEDSNIPYTNSVDIWAVGCIAYSLLTLENLFAGKQMVKKYGRGEITLDDAWKRLSQKGVSEPCIQFLKTVASRQGATRPTAAIAMQSSWIRSHTLPKGKAPADTEAFTTPFKRGNPFQATCVTVPNTVSSTLYEDTVTGTMTEPTPVINLQTQRAPPPVPPRANKPTTSGRSRQSCSERCKCAVCYKCSWTVAPNSTRNEYLMHSCIEGCFGTQPLCTNCLRRIDGGLFGCPRCEEVPAETYTRNPHPTPTSTDNSTAATTSTASGPQAQVHVETSDKEPSPKATIQPATPVVSARSPSVSTPLSQQSTLAVPQTQAAKGTGTGRNSPSTLPTTSQEGDADLLVQIIAALTVSIRCRVCRGSIGSESWTCLSCKEAGRTHQTCLSCVARSQAEYRLRPTGTLLRTCGLCMSLRCYLVTQSGASSQSSTSGVLCPDSCKCDRCGRCALPLASHWKCKLCHRARCAACADVSTTTPVPWCSRAACRSEMMSLAERNVFKTLALPLTTALLDMFRRTPLRPVCIVLGCSCDRCGECSSRLYTYRCVSCELNPRSSPKHICQRCIRQPMLLDEYPMCPDCSCTRFRVYAPRS